MAKQIVPPESGQSSSIKNDWYAGTGLAQRYLELGLSGGAEGHTVLIGAMEDAATAGSEALRGFGEKLHEHIAAILRQPIIEAPTVQQQLQEVIDTIPDLYDTLQSIEQGADERLQDGAPFGLFVHTAKRGMDLTDRIELMVEKIRLHRPPAESKGSEVQS